MIGGCVGRGGEGNGSGYSETDVIVGEGLSN